MSGCVSETGAGSSDPRGECGLPSTAVPDSREGAGRERQEAKEAHLGPEKRVRRLLGIKAPPLSAQRVPKRVSGAHRGRPLY